MALRSRELQLENNALKKLKVTLKPKENMGNVKVLLNPIKIYKLANHAQKNNKR